nr:NADH dehydrogenase subunit 2 [Gongylus gongylodes]
MPNNSTKILFLMTLISGVLISLCANSWLGAWMGLEINLLSFIPILSSNKNMLSTEASLKYFLIQSIASLTLIFMILLKINTQEMFYFAKSNNWNNLIVIPLLLKIACAPFHWWLPLVIEGLSWMNCFMILSIQKIAPLMMISYVLINSYLMQFMIMFSAISGAIGGYNQISLRKILSYSSINHIGWMLTAMIVSPNLWILYFIIYSINIISIILTMKLYNFSYIPQMFNIANKKMIKFTLFISMLSLGGLPPFLGFFPKWIMIQFMTQNLMMITTLILIMSSLLTLYYYMRIMYATLMITNSEIIWTTLLYPKYNYHLKTTTFLACILSLGMLVCTLVLTIY